MSKLSVVNDLFIHDDGSLPCFSISNLSKKQVIETYAWIKSNASMTPPNATYWNNSKCQDLPICNEENPAELVTTGEADSFSHSVVNFNSRGVIVYDFGIFVYSNSLEIFYRKGYHWIPEQISALLDVLQDILIIAPNAEISACEEDGTPVSQHYQKELQEILDH